MLTAMGCPYYYGIDICNTPTEEDNYETFLRLSSTRYVLIRSYTPDKNLPGSAIFRLIMSKQTYEVKYF